jgi:hypothetical protein
MDRFSDATKTVLVVEADFVERERLADALEAAGYEALMCAGPLEPDYACIGGREGWCPLMDKADVVVLDLMLESDVVGVGTPSSELLRLYLAGGKRVVALGPSDLAGRSDWEAMLVYLPWLPDPVDLVATVGWLGSATL